MSTLETQNNDLQRQISILNNERIKKEKYEAAYLNASAVVDVKLVYAKDFKTA